MRVALVDINTSLVKNVALYGTLPTIDDTVCVSSETAQIGDTYSNGIFTSPAPAPIVHNYKLLAQIALDISDKTILRCVEAGVEVPSAWATYRADLRSIVTNGSDRLPEQPDYPQGT